MREERFMRCIDLLKLANEPKSTRSAGKLIQRFTTRSAKKLYLVELLQKCFVIKQLKKYKKRTLIFKQIV